MLMVTHPQSPGCSDGSAIRAVGAGPLQPQSLATGAVALSYHAVLTDQAVAAWCRYSGLKSLGLLSGESFHSMSPRTLSDRM